MISLVDERRVGLEYLEAVAALLNRIRVAHPTSGLYEAAELQWWWAQNPRRTDDLGQLFSFDDLVEAWLAADARPPLPLHDSLPTVSS